MYVENLREVSEVFSGEEGRSVTNVWGESWKR